MSYNAMEDLFNKTQEEIAKLPKINLMVIGKTGVGKSTLINAVFREELVKTGQGKPVTKHLRKITKEGIPLVLYDTKGLELSSEALEQVTEEIDETLKSLEDNPEEHIHMLWYCIQAGSNRIEDYEIDLIKHFSEKLPVILVLTQSIGEPALEFKKVLEDMNLPVAGIVNVLAKDYEIGAGVTIPAWGLKELVALSYEVIPEDQRHSFINAQRVDIERKAAAARRWATRYIATTFGVGFTPIPFSDASVLVPLQVTMMAHITAIFGISIDKATITSIIAGLGGTGGATVIGRYLVSNALKLIPGAGTVVGGLISGTTASLVTTALAMSYIELLTIMAKRERQEGKESLLDKKEIQSLMKTLYKKHLKRTKKKK